MQYTSVKFTDDLDLEGIRPRSVGDGDDNALMECVIGPFKTEGIRTTVFHHVPYRQVTDVEWAAVGWVDWYNNGRLHSRLDYLPRRVRARSVRSEAYDHGIRAACDGQLGLDSAGCTSGHHRGRGRR